jgi:hypothetical protein
MVGVDAKGFFRKGFRSTDGKYSQFRAVMGTAVKVKDYAEFKDKFEKTLNILCKKYKVNRKQKILKSYDILSELGYPRGPNFLEKFFIELKPFLENITIFYTTIPSTKIPNIKKYGADKTGVEIIDPITFLKELEPTFPHLCTWQYVRLHGEDAMTPICVDYFEGELTDAWKQIRSLPNIKVYPSGDRCNGAISVADIVTKLVDLRLYKNKEKLYITCIKDCFPDYPIEVEFIDQLKFFIPSSRKRIDVSSKLAHPIIFVLKEGLDTGIIGNAKERDVIASSPLMDKVLDKAYEIDGCTKFFDVNRDQKLIKPGDFFLCLGDKSLETAKYMQNLGYPITVLLPEQV